MDRNFLVTYIYNKWGNYYTGKKGNRIFRKGKHCLLEFGQAE